MICTECNLAIPFYDEDVTVHVVYSDERGTERHCQHNPFGETDPAIVAILGSGDCAKKWKAKQPKEVTSVN